MSRKVALLVVLVYLCSVPTLGLCSGIGLTCSASTSNINFGTYNTIDTINLPASNITVTCFALFATVDPAVQLSVGSGTYAARTMSGSTGYILDYNLYTNSSYTDIFGNGTSGTGDETGGSQNLLFSSYTYEFPVYAQLPGGQNVAPGTYTTSQAITVTVYY